MAGLTSLADIFQAEQQSQELEELISKLFRPGLLKLRRLIDVRLAEIAEPEEPGQEEAQRQGAQQQPGGRLRSPGGGIYEEIKIIHGRPYRYERWREGDRLRSKYLGPAKQ